MGGTVFGDMQRSRRGSWKLLRSQNNPATTRFVTWGIKGIGSKRSLRAMIFRPIRWRKTLKINTMCARLNLFLTFLLLNFSNFSLKTQNSGKTHQIRVAAKAMGAPLLRYAFLKSLEKILCNWYAPPRLVVNGKGLLGSTRITFHKNFLRTLDHGS